MPYINLGIHGLLDQHIALRAGGLYWITANQPDDARLLPRQFLESLPSSTPAALIVCADPVQTIIDEIAPDRGPDKLKLFEIAQKVIEPGLATLTRDLGRARIAPHSQIVLLVPANSWTEASAAKRLQHWCEHLRPWLRNRNATLLVIAHGEASPLHAQLLALNEQLSGLSRLYRHNGETRYHVHFWYNDIGVSAGLEFKLSTRNKTLALIPEPVADIAPRVADDQHVYLAERTVLEGSPPLSNHWYLFNDRQTLLQQAASATAATVIVGIDSSHQLLKFQPVAGLKQELFLNQMCLRRLGDFACLFNGDLYLFLFACRADALEPALANICRLPWRDLFLTRQSLSSPTDLDQDAFMEDDSVPPHLNIPVEPLIMAQPAPGSRAAIKPQRITLTVSEPQP
ncbi:BcsE family c-di-GMP-binding protein [Pseudomonas helleri]|uniref:BcsE family c-di-GMP-binding protein n=1 Tax=Pseudomonas helleri TaxID=1608996 RepID=UPI003F954780